MEQFERFCERIRKVIATEKSIFGKIQNGRELLAELLLSQDWFFAYLKKMILEPSSFKNQRYGIWPNEFMLHYSPDQSFTVRAYIWHPYMADFIHDHGSYGIIGTLLAKMGEKKYERIDGGRREDYADLQETESLVYGQGETTFVLPLNEGIHALYNPTDEISVSISAYGKPVRRGFIHSFDLENKFVTRVFPPRTLKEILAVKTMAALDPSQAAGVFRKALDVSPLPQIRQEYEETLRKIALGQPTKE